MNASHPPVHLWGSHGQHRVLKEESAYHRELSESVDRCSPVKAVTHVFTYSFKSDLTCLDLV